MNNESKERTGIDWVRSASMLFCLVAGVAAAYLLLKYLLPALLPFIAAAIIAAIASMISSRVSKHTRVGSRTVSAAVLLMLLAVTIASAVFGIKRLLEELGRLAESLSDPESPLSLAVSSTLKTFGDIGDKISSILPQGENKLNIDIDGLLSRLAEHVFSALSSYLPRFLSSIFGALPGLFFGLAVTVIAAFYFTLDRKRILHTLSKLVPRSARQYLPHIKKEAANAALRYLRAYSLILLITFSELFFGLSVLGVEYSFLIAAVAALIDILPVLGVGTILIPWGIFCIISQNYFKGIGLIILYSVILIVRQFSEPKIVGESLGLHPLLTLIAIYLGYRLLGVMGMLLAPIALVIWRACYKLISPDPRSSSLA